MRRSATRLALSISLAVSGLTVAAPLPTTAQAETVNWSSLNSYVDKYAHETDLLTKSIIVPDLRKLLGKKFKTLDQNLEVQSPLSKDGNVLYLSGNMAHQGGSDGAYLLIETQSKSLEVGLWENSQFKVYRAGEKISKPDDIKQMFEVYETPLQ